MCYYYYESYDLIFYICNTPIVDLLLFLIASDDEICAEATTSPFTYLVPDVNDCTKFYMCQRLNKGKRGLFRNWRAHLMECPKGTGFDVKLRMCNWLTNLKNCI